MTRRGVRAGFTAADDYDRARPSYAPAAVRALLAALELDGSSRVLDLAAGTGQLSRLLLARVGGVVAVEPSRPMRELLARRLPGVEALDGEAERLPLANASVEAVVVGEAFHWFHGPEALAEIARVLRPGRGLALLWNVPIAGDPPWPAQLRELLRRLRDASVRDEQRYEPNGAWRSSVERCPAFGLLTSVEAVHEQHLDRDTIVSQIASYSFVAELGPSEREAVLNEARRLASSACTLTLRTDLHMTRSVERPATRAHT